MSQRGRVAYPLLAMAATNLACDAESRAPDRVENQRPSVADAQGTIDLPVNFEAVGIGRDLVLGVRWGEYDVDLVEGYRLERVG
jgi:hypothetical protein